MNELKQRAYLPTQLMSPPPSRAKSYSHLVYLEHLLKYLKGTIHDGLCYIPTWCPTPLCAHRYSARLDEFGSYILLFLSIIRYFVCSRRTHLRELQLCSDYLSIKESCCAYFSDKVTTWRPYKQPVALGSKFLEKQPSDKDDHEISTRLVRRSTRTICCTDY